MKASHRLPTVAALGALIAFSRPVPAARAATGSLDPGFGSGGTVTTASGGQGSANAVLVVGSGKVLAAGTDGDNFGLAVYSSAGTIDSSYGGIGTGIATQNLGPTGAAQSMVLRSDGHMWTGGGASGFGLALFGTDGGEGYVRVTANTYWAYGMTLLPNDGALLVGEAGNGRGTCALAAFDKTGVLIDGFGTHGIAVSLVGRCDGVVRLDDGRLVVTANEDATGTNGFGIARFSAGGVLDDSFGTHGVTLAFQDTSAFVRGIARQTDGKFVVVGQAGTGLATPKSIVIARFSAEGVLDDGFGDHGVIAIGLTGSPIALGANAVVIDGDGNIIVGGTATGPSNVKDGAGPSVFLIVRLLPSGQPDLSFGDDGAGAVFTGFGTGSSASLKAVTLQRDGKLVAAGRSCLNGLCGFALARYVLGAPVPVATTTTTLPGGPTTTTLPSTGCEGQAGLDGLRCLCSQGVTRSACSGQVLRRQIATLFGKACGTVERAANASKIALARRQYAKARGLLTKVSTVARRQSHLKKKAITAGCAAALEASFAAGRTLVDGVRAGLQR